MARPKKFPTKLQRMRVSDLARARENAKIRGISVTDYINLVMKNAK